MDVGDSLGDSSVFGSVALDVRTDALAMERMQTRVHEKLTIVKNSAIADVTVLSRVDRDVPVLLMATLRPEKLSVLRVLLNLRSQLFNLLLVVI